MRILVRDRGESASSAVRPSETAKCVSTCSEEQRISILFFASNAFESCDPLLFFHAFSLLDISVQFGELMGKFRPGTPLQDFAIRRSWTAIRTVAKNGELRGSAPRSIENLIIVTILLLHHSTFLEIVASTVVANQRNMCDALAE